MNINDKSLEYLSKLTGQKPSIANLLVTIRTCDEQSQVIFAKRLGITRQRLCDIEHGRSRISPKMAAKFAKKLGYNEAQFIRMALQDLLDKEHLHYTVMLEKAA